MAPETAAMASHAASVDPAVVDVRGELVEWMAVGWPEDWPDGRAPEWAPVYPRREA
jgi:hypothetical protein